MQEIKKNIQGVIIKTYIGLNLSEVLFLAYIRCFPVKLIVIFEEVEIDMYMPVLECCFIRNALTLLYVTIPSEATKSKIIINYYSEK